MSHATTEMPYFIKPSKSLSDDKKRQAYEQALQDILSLTVSESDVIMKMVSINCILKTHLPYYFWVGFYCVKEGALIVGPYQGTLGCLHIAFGEGICGQVAVSEETMIVNDVHSLVQGVQHIACDPNSRSEIVVPVFNSAGRLIAVFDVDSSLMNSFNAIDQHYLEKIMHRCFTDMPLTQTSLIL